MKNFGLATVIAYLLGSATTAASEVRLPFDYGGVYTVRIQDTGLEEFRHEAKVMGKWRQVDVAVKQVNRAGAVVDVPDFEGQSGIQPNPLFGLDGFPTRFDIRELRFSLGATEVIGVQGQTAVRELTFQSLSLVLGDNTVYSSIGSANAISVGGLQTETVGTELEWDFSGPILFESASGRSGRTVELEMGTFTTTIVPTPAGALLLGPALLAMAHRRRT